MLTDILADTILWFQRAKPQPTSKDFHTQLGCHFEEVAEMIATLRGLDQRTRDHLEDALSMVSSLASYLKAGDNLVQVDHENRVEFLDALCDQIVTAAGCGHMANMHIRNAMAEVNRSNFSKFDDQGQPIFDANRKIQKGPNYSKAHLTPYV
jgi:predicted HAD superfamily Cof-like phosphohydrolase